MADVDQQLDTVVESIRNSDMLAEADRERLLEFNRAVRRQRSTIGAARRLKYLKHLRIMGGHSARVAQDELPKERLVDALEDDAVVDHFLDWIHDRYSNEETNRDMRQALRAFGEHATEGDGKPDSIAVISASTPRNYDPKPDPAKMFGWEDHVLPMIEAAQNQRDAALIAVAWDSGARAGEICGLRVGDVADHKYGKRIHVDGKKGQRSVMLVSSVPYLRKWLDVHPASDDQSAPLWSKLSAAEDPSYEMKLKMLKEPARNSTITPPATPTFTRFRKSSASHLASEGVPQAHLEDHHGWDRGSDVAARYVAVFGDANDRAVARAHGVDVEDDEPDEIGPITCPRCEQETPRTEDFCVWCDQALDTAAARDVEQKLTAVNDRMREVLDDPEKLEDLLEVADILNDEPGLMT
jgi:integrase